MKNRFTQAVFRLPSLVSKPVLALVTLGTGVLACESPMFILLCKPNDESSTWGVALSPKKEKRPYESGRENNLDQPGDAHSLCHGSLKKTCFTWFLNVLISDVNMSASSLSA